MKEEQLKKVEENFLIDNVRQSYITKEQFISMLQKLDFSHIKDAKLHFITGFSVNKDDKDNTIVKTLGFDIEIY